VPVCFGGGVGCRPDGGVPDAGPGPDGALPDGAPPLDGAPQLPVTNGQPGDLFLGQPDGTSATANNGGRSAHSLALPSGGAAAGGRLWVVDQLNRRTLQWSAPPATNADADLVIGQMNGTLATQGLSYQLMPSPSRVSGSANRVAISDPGSNRVLLWTNLPAGNFGPASWVLGQNGSTTTTAGKNASQLEDPEGVWTDGDRVVVADSRNSRVLIWNAWPTQNGAPASLVIGRPAFGIGAGDGVPPASATSMNGAIDAWSDGTRLYVCDFNNNRVLVWRSFPTTNGQAADYVIGQSGPNAGSANAGQAGVNAAGLDGPIAVVGGRGSLFIADLANLRVVVHTPTPTTSGEPADAVLGQTDLVSRVITNLSAPVPSRIHAPAALGLDGAFLWVVDADWNRVGRYALRP